MKALLANLLKHILHQFPPSGGANVEYILLRFNFILCTLILPFDLQEVGAQSDTELLHMSPLRSGPHSPFPVQVPELEDS